jgi:hypothetical protein
MGGRDITDFDALGLKDRKLMLVSCKSRIYSGKFDQGDPGTIRATVNVAKEALSSLLEVNQSLRQIREVLQI